MKKSPGPLLLSLCLFMAGGNLISLPEKARGGMLSESPAITVNGRTDNELSETYGACQLTDFRHHSWLTAKAWNTLVWQSSGCLNAANDADYRHTLGPEYRSTLEILVDGKPQTVVPNKIAQQFDCRTTAGATAQITFQRLDMMLASLQWASAWRCENTTARAMQIEYRVALSDNRKLAKTLAETTDHYLITQDKFISYLIAFDRKPAITVSGETVMMAWKAKVAPGKGFAVSLGFRSGWGKADVNRARPGAMDYNTCAKLSIPALAQTRDLEFRSFAKLLGLPNAQLNWDGLTKLAAAKQSRLNEGMPRLTGFPAAWQGLFDYTLDLLRVGTKAPQGQCKGIWMVADPMFYLWTFYWDTALTAHSYCELDAAAAARTLLTFLHGGIQEDGHAWIQFNPVAHYPNDRPQLMNIPMALWDCYQISRNKEVIAEAYPILARHQEWIDRVWNKRPNGPIADLDWNIDYGSALDQGRHIWLDMTAFQVSQYEYLARMAELLGQDAGTIARWRAKAAQLKTAINKFMWNEPDGAYYCLKAQNLEQTKVSCPIEFYTLTTGVATQDQARRLIKRLLDPAKYAPGEKGRFFCPSVSYDDPSFKIVPGGDGGWGGNIWLVEPYYTVRGLARYGLQDEAFTVTTNLWQMVADEYVRTGSIWEQYNPATGRGIHLKYFTSGISSSIVDMLLRGVFGFERTDNPNAFYLTPSPVSDHWHGIENLPLSGATRLSIQMKKNSGTETACKVRFFGQKEELHTVEIRRVNVETGAQEQIMRTLLGPRGEASLVLKEDSGWRYLWTLR